MEMARKGLIERREVFYSGRVQGVGFRYCAANVATRHRVVGFVRNLDDGRVQLVVEGHGLDVERFLADVAETMDDNIRETRLDISPATGEFDQFNIRS